MNVAGIAEGHPDDATAVVERGVPTSYGELTAEVARVRGGVLGLGVRPGDRVALVVGNTREFVVGYLAVLGAGGVVVPLNPESPAAELDHQRTVTGATVTLTAADIDRLSIAAP